MNSSGNVTTLRTNFPVGKSGIRKICGVLFFLLCFSALNSVDIYAQSLADGQPSVLKEDKAPSNYVYDLKVLIQKSRENIRNVNEKIKDQAVQKRNQQREDKAREYFLQAQKLADEGRLEESRQLYDKAIRITEHPEMKFYIKESDHRAKVQRAALSRQEGEIQRRSEEEEKSAFERVENMYQGAVSLYKQQRFKEAKEEFLTVDDIYPDYKAVRSYLQIIEQDIVQSEHLQVKGQKKEIESQQKELEIARLREKELWRKEIDRKEEERKKQLASQAQGVYDEAVSLYQDRKYMAAKEKFQEVEWVVPDFKATRSYLQRIERDVQTDKERVGENRKKTLEKQRWEEALAQKKAEEDHKKAIEVREREKSEQNKDQAEFVYQSAMSLFNKDQYAQARDKFDEVEALYPDYKSTRDYAKRIDDMLKTSQEREEELRKSEAEKSLWEETAAKRKEEKEKLKKVTEEADSLYTEAFNLYKMGRLIESKEKFLEVDQRVPDYKSARSYLKRIDEDISVMVAENRKESDLAFQKTQLERLKELRDKADIIYNEAIVAYDNKDFGTAKAKFQGTEDIFPNYKKALFYLSRIDEDIEAQRKAEARGKLEKEAENLLAQALALYANGAFEESKARFIEVAALIPDYKQTAFYLERIDDDIIRNKQKALEQAQARQAETLYNQAITFYQSSDYAEAKGKFLELEAVLSNYKDTSKYLSTIDADIQRKRAGIEQESRTASAEKAYKQALDFYQAGNFTAAKEKFIQTEVLYPDYKETSRYLLSINTDIKKRSVEVEGKKKADAVEPLYIEAQEMYKVQEFTGAKKKFLEVQMVYPDYKDVTRYLARVDKDISSLEERIMKEERLRKADIVYTTAIKLYAQNNFDEAKAKFREASAIDPNYRGVKGYLARIDNDIRHEHARLSTLQAQEQAESPYAQAVELYHAGKYELAKSGFKDVEKIVADYKKTRSYLARIDADISASRKEEYRQRLARAEDLYREAALLSSQGDILKAYQKYSEVEALCADFKNTRKTLGELKSSLLKSGIVLPETVLVVAPVEVDKSGIVNEADENKVLALYKEAVGFYKDKKYSEAREKFTEVQRLSPGYRSTQRYFDMIAGFEPTGIIALVPVAGPLPAQGQVRGIALKTQEPLPSVVTAESEEKQQLARDARTVTDLSRKSGDLYRQIRALADDKNFADVARTFSRIDKVVANLENEKKRLARAIEHEDKQGRSVAVRAQGVDEQDRSMEKNAVVRQKALKQKQQDKNEEDAQLRESENLQEMQDIKRKERAQLNQIREQEKETRLKAEVFYQQGMGVFKDKKFPLARERFLDAQKLFPGYKDTDQWLEKIERAEGEQLLLDEEARERVQVAAIAEKANTVNIDALVLSNKKDFIGLQQKFDELSSMLKEIEVIKGRMMARREAFRVDWENRLKTLRADTAARPGLVKEMKPVVEGSTVRQQAEAFYKQGEEFYSRGQYAEARVKFRDSFAIDSTFKAAYTYAQRIDRILERKDFEEQKIRIRKENRKSEKKREGIALSGDDKTPDPARAKEVYEEGVGLYKAKRYKEARVKFEELMKVGDDVQSEKSGRYLALIETGMEKARKESDQEQRKQQERYLEAKRAEIRMSWEKDKGLQAKQIAEASSLAQHNQELSVERQLLLRNIEKENDAQRKKILVSKFNEQSLAEKTADVERGKIKRLAAGQKMKMEGSRQAVAGQPDAIDSPKASSRQEKNVPTDIKVEAESRDKIVVKKGKKLSLSAGAIDKREDQQFKRILLQQRIAQEKEEQRLRIQQERERQAQELEKMRAEEKKRRSEEALVRRSGKDIGLVMKPILLSEKSSGKTSVAAQSVVIDPKIALDPSMNEEKVRLEGQRLAIQRDFEKGIERLYLEAVDFYTKHQYDLARADFQQIDALIKGYKKTGQYLILIKKETDRNVVMPIAPDPVRPPSVKADARQQAVSRILDSVEAGVSK